MQPLSTQSHRIYFGKCGSDVMGNMPWIKATLDTCEFVLKMALQNADEKTMQSMKSGFLMNL